MWTGAFELKFFWICKFLLYNTRMKYLEWKKLLKLERKIIKRKYIQTKKEDHDDWYINIDYKIVWEYKYVLM